MALFVDDAVADRGHRNALQNPDYFKTGVAFCKHNSRYEEMIALAYASTFEISAHGHQ